MKYWWLEKYHNFRIVQIEELIEDVNYFLTMPKNYEEQYQEIKKEDINSLEEEELLILLKKIVNTKNIKDNSLRIIIEKLLLIPDNSFPTSDYTLSEQLMEIKNLRTNLPLQEKLETNNIAICYHCLNIFYVDKIKNTNKKGLCLCPYCFTTKLYFDNDYIPMNYTFIKLANLYYSISNLGCSFKEIQKIAKKNITTTIGKMEPNSIELSQWINSQKIEPIDEKIISRKLYQKLMLQESNLANQTKIYVCHFDLKVRTFVLEILLVTLLEVLSNTIYLKEINVIFEKEEEEQLFHSFLKIIKTFY